MSLETNAGTIIGGAMIDAFGGSVVLFGLVFLLGIGILMKKLELGLSAGIMIAIFILGMFADNLDSKYIFTTPIGGQYPMFKLLFLGLIIGVAVYWAIFLRRR